MLALGVRKDHAVFIGESIVVRVLEARKRRALLQFVTPLGTFERVGVLKEEIEINRSIRIKVLNLYIGRVRLGFKAPSEISIVRENAKKKSKVEDREAA